jgi:thiol-disulfide isomerase/thioredoxin
MNVLWRTLVLFVAAWLPVVCAGAADAPAAAAAATPQLVVQTLDGRTFNLAAERGRWVIVNFWATWCRPCIEEMPAISKFVASHKHVAAIGIAWDRASRAELLKFVRKHPVAYPVALVDMDKPPGSFPLPQVLPTTILIAPDGRVAKPFIGPVNGNMLAQAITAAKAAFTAPAGPGG